MSLYGSYFPVPNGINQLPILIISRPLFPSQTQAEVKMLLSPKNITVETRQFSSSRGPEAVEDIFVRGKYMRVFILNMYSLFASRVLCKVSRPIVLILWVCPYSFSTSSRCSQSIPSPHNYCNIQLIWRKKIACAYIHVYICFTILNTILQAYHEGMYYPNYVWITYGWYNSDWWRGSKGNHNCTDEEMHRVLERSLSIVQYPVTNTSKETDSGLVRHVNQGNSLSCTGQLSIVGCGWGARNCCILSLSRFVCFPAFACSQPIVGQDQQEIIAMGVPLIYILTEDQIKTRTHNFQSEWMFCTNGRVKQIQQMLLMSQ